MLASIGGSFIAVYKRTGGHYAFRCSGQKAQSTSLSTPSTNGTAPPSNALDPCPFSVATLRTMSLSACLWNALAHCDCRTLSFSWTRPHQTPKYRLLNSPDGGSSEETSHGSNGTSPESIPSSEIERVPTPRALHDNAQENMSPTRACNRKRARPPPSWHSATRKLVF